MTSPSPSNETHQAFGQSQEKSKTHAYDSLPNSKKTKTKNHLKKKKKPCEQVGPKRAAAPPAPTALILCRVGFVDLIVKPHVGHCHPVLGESSSFIRADGGRRPQGLHGF